MDVSMNASHSAAERIRWQLERVAHLRAQAQRDGLSTAVQAVKRLQASRFRATYADFLADPRHAAAASFFLDELYGEQDFVQRDLQFARIAGAIERLFPAAVAHLAVDLAEAHALTEALDHQMGEHWLALEGDRSGAQRYVHCWRLTGERAGRQRQLTVVLELGEQLQKLTRMKSLLIALKLMRSPAQAAGLASLQQFLESGFAAFATMGDARHFLTAIAQREQRWIDSLFDEDFLSCQRSLAQELRRA
jgi:hypothetical protein